MRRDFREYLDGADLIQIAVPILIEAVAVVLFCAAGLLWIVIASTPAVPA